MCASAQPASACSTGSRSAPAVVGEVLVMRSTGALVLPANQQAVPHERGQPAAQHRIGDTQRGTELLEPAPAVQGVPHDQQGPRVADDVQAPSDRAHLGRPVRTKDHLPTTWLARRKSVRIQYRGQQAFLKKGMPVPRLRRRWHPALTVLDVSFLALIAAAGFRAAPGPLLPALQDEFGWSTAAISARSASTCCCTGSPRRSRPR